jgi:hypothetical protein
MRGTLRSLWSPRARLPLRFEPHTQTFPCSSTAATNLPKAYVSISQNTLHEHASAYASIRQQPPAHVSKRQHTSAYTPATASIRQHTTASARKRQHTSAYVSIRQHTSATASIRQHTSAYASIHQHTPAYARLLMRPQTYRRKTPTSAYVSIRQHTPAYARLLMEQRQTYRRKTLACGPRPAAQRWQSAYVSIRQHTSAYVSIRQHTPANLPPQDTCVRTTPRSATMAVGVCRGSKSPRPRQPSSFDPHASTAVECDTAMQKLCPLITHTVSTCY